MDRTCYAVPCEGTPCDAIKLSRESHGHMPLQLRLPNKLVVDPEVQKLAQQLLRHSVDGLIGDEDAAWDTYRLERFERELGATAASFAQDKVEYAK